MHETALLRDLMARVESEVAATTEPVRRLRFRVGALAGISPETLRQGACHYALEEWGYAPDIEIEESTDPTDPGALGVSLVSIGIGG